MFEKTERYWLIEDTLSGSGKHTFRFCFHIAPGLEILPRGDGLMEIRDNENNARLLIASLDLKEEPGAESRWFSRDYGAKIPSVALCWKLEADPPLHVRWLLVPICAGEDTGTRLALVSDFRSEN